MTAGAGIVHEEFHSDAFARAGGPMRMVQLWVNLPAKDKMARPAYQSILAGDIPTVDLPDSAGSARIIAGRLGDTSGPAHTFTPLNVWDVRLNGGAQTRLPLPEGHTAMVVVLSGRVAADGDQVACAAQMLLLDRADEGALLTAKCDATLLVLTGEPIDEPIVGYGPFVMNSETEIRQAIDDFNSGRFAEIAAA
jgi:redox-sensitive bicupin YhaK (pirin superfamily)